MEKELGESWWTRQLTLLPRPLNIRLALRLVLPLLALAHLARTMPPGRSCESRISSGLLELTLICSTGKLDEMILTLKALTSLSEQICS